MGKHHTKDAKLQVLLAVMNEHYQHAREHEQLRSNASAFLLAASAAIGAMAIDNFDKGEGPFVTAAAGAIVFVLGLFGNFMGQIHKRRFDAHVQAARQIREGLENHLWRDHPMLPCPSEASAIFKKNKHGVVDGVSDDRKVEQKGATLDGVWRVLDYILIIGGLALVLVSIAVYRAA